MDKKIYYYKDSNGRFHFSNGQLKNEDKAAQYLRMLRYAKYEPVPLYLDNIDDYKIVKEKFNIQPGTPWQKLYYQ